MKPHATLPFALLCLLALAACEPRTVVSGRSDAGASSGKDADEWRMSFQGEDITLKTKDGSLARITPEGDLQIDGKPVEVDAEQRKRLLAYRQAIGDIGRQGAAIGKQGAAIGARAATEAIKGVFTGNTDDIGARVEAEAEKMTQEALKICDHVENLRQAQDALVQVLPAFQPFANIDRTDIADCRK